MQTDSNEKHHSQQTIERLSAITNFAQDPNWLILTSRNISKTDVSNCPNHFFIFEI